MKLLLAAAVTAAGLLLPAAAARASCAPPPPAQERLAAAEAAFVGTYVSSRTDPDGRHFLTFRVELTFKGTLPQTLDVHDPYGPVSSVALNPRPGERLGLYLERAGHDWAADDCHRTSQEELEDASAPPCRASGLPRRYRRAPRPRRMLYTLPPRVIACGRVPGGTAYKLIAYRIASRPRARGMLCVVAYWPTTRRELGCADRRVAGSGPIEAGVQDDSPFRAMGDVDPFARAVRVRYRADGTETTRAGSLRVIAGRRALRRLGLRRPFAVWVGQLPDEAVPLGVEALAWHGDAMGSAPF